MNVAIPDIEPPRMILRDIRLADQVACTRNFVDYEVVRHLAATIPWLYPEDGFADLITKCIEPSQVTTCWC